MLRWKKTADTVGQATPGAVPIGAEASIAPIARDFEAPSPA
jgi:hypothetical protein